jgi:hypothetical protein
MRLSSKRSASLVDPQEVALNNTISDLRRISAEIRITNRELRRVIKSKGFPSVEV